MRTHGLVPGPCADALSAGYGCQLVQCVHPPRYYVDRDYVLVGLPPFLQYLVGIKTAMDDAHSDPSDAQFLCFSVTERARVFVLFDARASDQPQWLKDDFIDKHEETVENTEDSPVRRACAPCRHRRR